MQHAPDDIGVKIEYASTLGAVGRHRQALDIVDEVLLQEPDNATALRVAGWLLTSLGRRSDAHPSYSRAAEVAPDDIDALTELASAQDETGRPAEALATLDRATTLKETAAAMALRSRVLSGLALWTDAIVAGERAVSLDPESAEGCGALGWAISHHLPVDAQRMHDVFRAAVGLDEQDEWVHKEFGDALLLLNRTDEARQAFLRAIELAAKKPSNDFSAHSSRAWCLFQLGRHREAAEAYSQAEPGHDSPVQLLMDMGLNALAASNEQEARSSYDRGLYLAARDPSPKLRGDLAVAVIDLRIAMQLGRLTEGPVIADLIGLVSAAFDKHPLPSGISARFGSSSQLQIAA
jgi:tetratricopeptide (TPR) repeat protein